ncbi:Cytidylyltransferase [Penicillium coprophilum]|uniref:Cytidylyltransferase n=1 Tax=Penicillium coprophilum TaxID=36646 RepID=UPI0023A5B3FB|nr:Cytidylyltransferase [Penicillium coprophilum]KAJ5171581.1 Cytidylyltransferase [Penicillium coprophilum]
MSSFQALRIQYSSLLKRFLTSIKDFETRPSIPPPRAHLRIASTALLENPKPRPRLLLLLATQNADKPSKPASFEDRLVMMELFARDLRAHLESSPAFAGSGFTHGIETLPLIDIGVTKKPYFVDKAAAIEASGSYPVALEQVHLTGYDTLIRILDPKYYPPEHTLKPLEPFLSKHRLRVTMRPSDEGDRDGEGMRREWAERIQLVDGRAPTERAVSSTRAREASKTAPRNLDWLVPEQVRQFVLSEHPYSEDSKV